MEDLPSFRFTSNSLFPDTIVTERIRFEKLCHENVDTYELYEYLGTSDTVEEETKHVHWEPHDSPLETKELIDDLERQWQDGTKAGYVVRSTEDRSEVSDIAGVSTLSIDWDRRVAEIGLFLRKPYWGREYSAERAEAFFELTFEVLDVEVLEVSCSTENDRAKRAIEKYVQRFGGEYVGVRYNMLDNQVGDPVDCHLYTVTRAQYRSSIDAP